MLCLMFACVVLVVGLVVFVGCYFVWVVVLVGLVLVRYCPTVITFVMLVCWFGWVFGFCCVLVAVFVVWGLLFILGLVGDCVGLILLFY